MVSDHHAPGRENPSGEKHCKAPTWHRMVACQVLQNIAANVSTCALYSTYVHSYEVLLNINFGKSCDVI
jgi:hypothetical protein